MNGRRERKDAARAERIIPGIWRIRVPLPWFNVPHVNAYALSAGDGIVLIDTATTDGGDLRPLEMALAQIGWGLDDISLIVCTHSHVDHYGLAKPLVEATGAPLWLHPAWGHVRKAADDPRASRLEIARIAGLPDREFERLEQQRTDEVWLAGIAEPDLELLPGVTVETDLGGWEVHETPGHAPSHVVLHQPERRLMISGDHLLGRVSVFFDYGHTPDPIGEFLTSLDRVAALDVGLVLAGHGRPFRDPEAKVIATRKLVEDGLERTRSALSLTPGTAYEILTEIAGAGNLNDETVIFGLQVMLCYLDHLKVLGEATVESGGGHPVWELTGR